MTDLRKAAEMALDALDLINQDIQKHRATLPIGRQPELCKASLALRQALAESANSTTDVVESKALAQQEQKPVAWDGACVLGHCDSPSGCETSNCCRADYTAPPKREWVGLTDEDYNELLDGDWGCFLIKEVEAKLKEKNA